MKDHDATEQAYKNGYEKAKQEVAREIFEEIVKLLIFNTYEIACISKTDLVELKKKYIGE